MTETFLVFAPESLAKTLSGCSYGWLPAKPTRNPGSAATFPDGKPFSGCAARSVSLHEFSAHRSLSVVERARKRTVRDRDRLPRLLRIRALVFGRPGNRLHRCRSEESRIR